MQVDRIPVARGLGKAAGVLLSPLVLGMLLATGAGADWTHVGGGPENTRYSPLAEIDRSNVADLEVLWTYRHGDHNDPRRLGRPGSGTAFQATPILIDDLLIFPTPYSRVIALDPDTGTERWTFDPGLDRTRQYAHGFVNRGVAHWRDPEDSGPCAGRIFVVTTDARLIALDVATGEPCRKFGKGGTFDLHIGAHIPLEPEHYKFTSNPVVVGDVVVVGPSSPDRVDPQPSSNPRAFDARSGAPLWEFDMIPREGQYGVETWEDESWRHGYGVNPWAPMSVDPDRNLVFVPGSAPSPHFYGGLRPGDNLYGTSLLVVDGTTGERQWHFQAVRGDIWDYDLASPPMLVRLERDAGPVDAVVQLTKMGLVYVLDRDSGEPLFPVEDRPTPRSDIPGERPAATQPHPLAPPPLVPSTIRDEDLWHDGPPNIEECRARLAAARHEGLFTPVRKNGGLVYPSNGGGANWSGGGFDPERQMLYVPVNDFAVWVELSPEPLPGAEDVGEIWTHSVPSLFSDSAGHRCLAPPWGWLVGVDLATGELRFRVPVGEDPETGVRGLANMGPLLVTAGGLVFHGGTPERGFYAYDADDGAVLARFDVPAGVHGGPMTYQHRSDGRQVIVVPAGGHHLHALHGESPTSDWVIAYALPDRSADAAEQ